MIEHNPFARSDFVARLLLLGSMIKDMEPLTCSDGLSDPGVFMKPVDLDCVGDWLLKMSSVQRCGHEIGGLSSYYFHFSLTVGPRPLQLLKPYTL